MNYIDLHLFRNRIDGWIDVNDSLPLIPEGDLFSEEVLIGYCFIDSCLEDEHQFSWGKGRLHLSEDLKNFPLGVRWHTYGPSHNQIQFWQPKLCDPPWQLKPFR